MSKIDALRRMREEQQAQEGRGSPARTPDVPAKGPAASSPARRRARGEAPPASRDAVPASTEAQGKCTGCGKTKALQNGLVVGHQKGLGKMCPGSREAPAPP